MVILNWTGLGQLAGKKDLLPLVVLADLRCLVLISVHYENKLYSVPIHFTSIHFYSKKYISPLFCLTDVI